MIRRILAGLGLSGAITLVLAVARVVAVPILLARWGAQVYGEWLTLTSLAASLSMLNLGVQSYIGNRLIACHTRGQLAEGVAYLQSAMRLYAVLGGLALAATLALFAWPDAAAWLNVRETPAIQARLILLIEGLLVVFSLWNGLIVNLLRVTQQLPRQLAYRLAGQVVSNGAPMAVAAAGGRPVQASLAAALLAFGVGAVAMLDAARRSPFQLGFARGSWRLAFSLLGPSLVFFAVALSAQLLSTGMTILIAATTGAAAVALFNTALMLTNFVRVVIYQGLDVLWPEVTAAAARAEDLARLSRWHRLTLKLVGLAGLAAGLSVALLGPRIVALWTGGRIVLGDGLNLLFVLYLLVQTPALVSSMFGLATNRQAELLWAQLATALLSVGLAALLLPRLGLPAAALGLALGQAAGTLWVVRMACRWTSDASLALARDVALRALPTLAVGLSAAVAAYLLVPGLGERLAALAALLSLVGLAGWWTWLTPADRASLAASRLAPWRSRVANAKEVSI